MLNESILRELEGIAGDALTEKDQALLEAIADQLADLTLDTIAGRPVHEHREAAIKASLRNLSSAARTRIERQATAVIKDAVADGIAIAGDLLKAALT
jgi:hypothetical protein